MSKNNKVLVLSDDDLRGRDITTILEFVGEEQVLCGDDALALLRQAGEDELADVSVAILNGEDGRVRDWVGMVCKASRSLPLLVVGDPELKGLNDEVAGRVIARLEWPLSYTKFVDSLYRAQVFREQYGHSLERGRQRAPQLFRSLVGTSRKVQEVRRLMEQVADKDVSVLITGESGTGKEVVARNLHYHSSRRDRPFVPVNCGAIPAELLESELFGHEKGAFTGAITARVGRFEMAEGGTLFLDEIGDMPLEVQSKLLRVLQDRMVERVGGEKPRQIDFRLCSATNRDLEQFVEQGKFRLDLFYRISPVVIHVPPLADRVEDIPLLVNHFLKDLAERYGRDVPEVDSDVFDYLMSREWPGNVRELRHLTERAFVFYEDDRLQLSNFRTEKGGEPMRAEPSPAGVGEDGQTLRDALERYERELVAEAMVRFRGNKKRVAEHLGISRSYLYKKFLE